MGGPILLDWVKRANGGTFPFMVPAVASDEQSRTLKLAAPQRGAKKQTQKTGYLAVSSD